LVQSDAKTDSSWVVSSCLTSSIDDCMVVFMVNFNGCIDGGNNGTKLFHFFLGLEEIRLQGVEASFQVLATGMGHEDG
jgi:tryptophan synthase beta subunit